MALSDREKIAHLYRRFGFGASPKELEEGVKRGVDGVLRHLIDFQKVDEGFDVSPFEFIWRDKPDMRGEMVDLSATHYRAWWVFRMLATQRPLQEKLTLFWHNHFAVGNDKVEDAPMMLQYLDVLRRNAVGKFETLLQAVSKNPAMMRYLDMTRAIKGRPNENFAREVMELFTLGIGNYTERDVQEVSRALTGWGFVNTFNDVRGSTTDKMMASIDFDRPFTAFAYMPDMRDTTPKTILGKTADFDGDSVLVMLATNPTTARRMVTLLWEFFAYEKPAAALVERLAGVWTKSGGDLRQVLFAIGRSPEFFSDTALRTMVKSPVDLCVGMARQMGVGESLMALRSPSATPKTMIPGKIRAQCAAIAQQMGRQGLSLFYPPDVSGWRWHAAWVSPAMMLERMKWRGALLYERGVDTGGRTVFEYVKAKSPADGRGIAAAMAELFDLGLPAAALDVVGQVFDAAGGPTKVLATPAVFMQSYERAIRLMMAAPEAQFC